MTLAELGRSYSATPSRIYRTVHCFENAANRLKVRGTLYALLLESTNTFCFKTFAQEILHVFRAYRRLLHGRSDLCRAGEFPGFQSRLTDVRHRQERSGRSAPQTINVVVDVYESARLAILDSELDFCRKREKEN